jgi:hypothetical protein
VFCKTDDGLKWKAYIRALPCLAPSDIHTVLSSVSKTRQCIVSPSFHSKPPSTCTEISSKSRKFRGSRGVFNGFELRGAKLFVCSVSDSLLLVISYQRLTRLLAVAFTTVVLAVLTVGNDFVMKCGTKQAEPLLTLPLD